MTAPHAHDHPPAHDTADDHGGSRLGRATHAVSHLVGAHSHDAADKIDDAAETTAAGRRALYLSLVIMLATALVQTAVVALSGSVALLGDTLHNFADALTAVPLLIAFRLVLRPVSDRFTYGYGRAEDLAGIFVVAMIALSSALAAYEAIRRLVHPQDVQHLWAVAAASLVGFAGNEWVAVYRIRVGRRIGSAALVADGLHARTDGLTSLAVLLGVAGSALGWRLADPIVGLLITVAILGILRSAAAQVGGRLMDAVDPGTVETLRSAAGSEPGVEVAAVRLRWIGHELRAEAELEASPDLTVSQVDDLVATIESRMKARVPRLMAVTTRVRPREATVG